MNLRLKSDSFKDNLSKTSQYFSITYIRLAELGVLRPQKITQETTQLTKTATNKYLNTHISCLIFKSTKAIQMNNTWLNFQCNLRKHRGQRKLNRRCNRKLKVKPNTWRKDKHDVAPDHEKSPKFCILKHFESSGFRMGRGSAGARNSLTPPNGSETNTST